MEWMLTWGVIEWVFFIISIGGVISCAAIVGYLINKGNK
jgi:hypothetical protein